MIIIHKSLNYRNMFIKLNFSDKIHLRGSFYMDKKNLYVSLAILCTLSAMSLPAEAKMTKEAHSLYQQACAYEYKNDYNTAIRIIKQALDLTGEDAMLYTKIAGLYSDIGNYQEALSAYKKAIKLRPNDAFIYISMGNILQTIGDYENAYNSFKQAQTIYPEYKYNYLNIANVEYFRKNYKNAIENYNAFLSAYPDHMEAGENLANVYVLSGETEKACEIYSNLYKKYPSAFTEYEKYGFALFDTKQYQASAEMLEKALNGNEDNENINARLALCYQNLGDNEKSLEYFEQTFKLNPDLTSLRFDYANLLGNIGKYEQAIEQYKKYLTAYPEEADAYKNLGLVYKKSGNNDLALFNLEKAYSKDSSDLETKKELAFAYHSKKDYAKALKFYDFALKSEPDNPELLANKALTLHAMNNYVTAIEIYKELLDKQPNERIKQNLTSASIAYGYSLYDKEDYGQAILYFEDAIDLNNKEASAYFGYAKANAKMGCVDIALESYEKAAQLAPGNVEYATEFNEYRTAHKNTLAGNLTSKPVVNEPILNIVPTAVATEDVADSFESLVFQGDDAYKNQKYDKALDCYTKAVIYNPSDKVTMLKIANIYKLKGNNAKAIDFYDKIISMDKNCSDAYFNKGLVFANQKNYDYAIKCFEKVIELSPDYPYAYYSLGMAYELKNMPEKAVEYYLLYTGIESDEKMLNIVNQRIKQLDSGSKN